jgi:hypothetical protein
MMNERSSAQANTPTSASMPYGYPGHFDMINMQTMQNPNDLYSYYPPSLYQPFGTFDDHNQWGSTDSSGNVAPPPQGPIQFHPQMYTPSPLDIPRSPFDYPPPHAYPHYHPAFTQSTFPGPPSNATSAFDMSWTPHNLSMQQIQVAAQQMTPIGGGPNSNKKSSVYDDYPAGGVGDMLAQHMNSVDLGSNPTHDDAHNYDNGNNDNTQNVNVLSSKEQQQQHYQSNTNNLSLSSRPSQAQQSSSSGGPKSYASVVSSDTINTNSNKPTSAVSNIPMRSTVQSSTNNPTSNFSNDSTNSRSNTNLRGGGGNNNNNNNNNTNNYPQQTRNGTTGYNSRNQQQSSASGGYLNWTNSSLPSNSRGGGGSGGNNNTSSTYYNSGSSNYYDRSSYSQQQTPSNNKRQNSNYQQNYSSSRTANNLSNGNAGASAMGQIPISAANQEILDTLKRNHQYNPKDFNLNPKGARFFVIKSYSEDDVHRSIKYNIWCSTEHGNKRLDNAFREREGKGPIYLFFSVNASGHFCGMAEMMSPVDYEHQTDVWQMSNKWQGKFEVKWIYVKDVPNQQFRNIRLENNDNKPVTNSRDTQEIPYEKGKLMLKTMHMYRDKTSIFDDFQYYESKQAEEATTITPSTTKKSSNNDFNNNPNHPRGTNPNKRQYSSNKTSANQSEQQQQNENTN